MKIMYKDTKFRLWVFRLWHENLEERFLHKEEQITIQEYWEKYKWWIKREYRHQTRKNK